MMDRLTALALIDEIVGEDPLVVTCGATSRELAARHGRDTHLYLLDSMGLSAAVGLGLALVGERPVWAIEGDGSLLMGLTVLPTLGVYAPPAYTLIVLDNQQHASADQMPTQAVHLKIADLTAAASLRTVVEDEPRGLGDALRSARDHEGPNAVIARITGGNAPGVPWLLHDPAVLSADFQRRVRSQPTAANGTGAAS